MNKEKLTNIRNNLINGNQTDAREGIKEYGLKPFGIDYLRYLWDLYNHDKDIAYIVLGQLENALIQIQYIN